MKRKDKYSRFGRVWYEKPTPPIPNEKKFAIIHLRGCSDRYTGFPDDEHYYERNDELTESTGELHWNQYLSLKEINKIVKEKDIDEKEVFFTVSFSEDYLCLEALQIREMSEEEKTEQYEAQCEEWLEEERELQRIKYEMESLQRRADALAKKKK